MSKKLILIADDDKDIVAALSMRCKKLGLEVVAVEDALTALSTVDFVVPDLVCLDVSMPGGNGLAACEMMATDQRLSSIPVIILTGSSDSETIRRCEHMNAHYVLKTHNVWPRMESLIRDILYLEKEEIQPGGNQGKNGGAGDARSVPFVTSQVDNLKTVLIADDDRDLVNILSARCEQIGLKAEAAYDARTAFTAISQRRPDLVCLDVNMPSGSGLALCEMLANDEDLSSIPVIMLTGSVDEETIRRCHSMCAYYVQKSPDVWQRVEPILRELLDIKPDESGRTGPGNFTDLTMSGQGLSHLIDAVAGSKDL